MGKRTCFKNKVVAILMVILLIVTGFIQPVGAIESNSTEESTEPVAKEESVTPEESTEPAAKEESVTPEESTEPAAKEESITPEESTEPAAKEESVTPEESAEPAVKEDSKTTDEISEPTGTAENKMTTEVSPNVLGSLMKDGNPLSGTSINLYHPAEDQWYNAVVDQIGNFGFTIPDGEYQLQGIWVESESKWYPYVVSFMVQDGKVDNPDLLKLDLTEKEPNATGSILKDGQPVKDVWVSAHTVLGEEQWFNGKTDGDGKFSLSLPDGEYQIDGVWVESESKWYPYVVSFMVQDGKVDNPDLLKLDLTEKGPNATGSILKDGQPVKDVWVSAHTVLGEEQWFNDKTDGDGKFSLSLPDGEYQIDGVWVESESKWYPYVVSFMVQDGKVDNPDLLKLDLTEKGPNATGFILKDGQPVKDVWVSAHTVTGEEKWYNGKTGENGEYKLTLPDGEYQIDGVWVDSESKWYPIVVSFKVQDGEVDNPDGLKFDLTEKGSNVTGSVVKDGKPVVGDWVNAHTATGVEIWFNAMTDENGDYGLTLPDGDFIIEGIWVDEEQKWYPLNMNFSVVGGVLQGQTELVIDLSGEQDLNVKGSIKDENGKVTNVDITMKNVDTGEYFYSSTNENGEFGLQLDDGQYKIELVVVDGALDTPIYLDKEFSVKNGKLQVAGTDAELLDVSLPAFSLNVQLVKDGEPLKNIQVEIVQSNEEADRYIYKNVDDNGIASFRMNDGEYRVAGYYDNIERKSYFFNESITVMDGTTSPNPYIIDVTNSGLTSIKGSLSDSKGFVGNSKITFSNRTIGEIFITDVNSDGSFSQDVPDGEYSIESIYSDAFNYVYDVKINTDFDRFTISEGIVSVNGAEVENLDLSIPTESLKVQIVNNEVPVKGNLLIFNDHDSWYTSTNENGELILRVPNGEYTIDSFDYENNNYPINKIVNANNESLETVIIDLAIPGDGIVSGTVMDGETFVANSQFTIQNTAEYWDYYQVSTDVNGQFSADISDGDYVINTVNDVNGNPIAYIDFFFSVKNGEMVVNQKVVNDITIELPSESLHVQILKNGTPLNGEVNVTKMVSGYELSYIVDTDKDGKFALRVPDGVYTISGLYEMEEPYDWYVINTDVEVSNGTTTPNPFVIDLEADSEGYHGVVQDENGPQSGGFVLIKDTASDNWISVDVNEVGEFAFDLPDGNYIVTQYYSETVGDVILQIHFSIQDGQIMVNGKATDQLNITLPSVAVKGTVIDDQGTPISGGKIGIIEMNNEEAYSRYWELDGNGQFSLRLPDGEYKVTAISHNDERIPMQRSFSVQDGVLMVDGAVQERLNLQLPQSNFKGQLLQLGEPLADSIIYMLSNYGPDKTSSFPIMTDGYGYFSERLGDGSYLITGIDTPFQYVEYYQEFEVINGTTSIDFSTLEVSESNVQGLVQDVDGKTYGDGGFLEIVDTNGDWYYADITSNGEFSLQLLDGEYTVVGLWSYETGSINLQVPFTVQNGELVNPLVVTMPNDY